MTPDVLACAALVEKGDPDRFLATMAAPPALRERLFPLYAFNLELARAPRVAQEPLIAEMRLQWWRDALDEIASGRPVRRHEVATPLAEVLEPGLAGDLDDMAEAWRREIAPEPFADAEALMAFLDRTAGTLLWTAARLTGVTAGEAAIRARGRAQGLANWFLAAPRLVAEGRSPLPDPAPQGIADLARAALADLSAPAPRSPALLAAWRARPLLRQAARDPARVLDGRLSQSEFARRGGLILRSFGL